LVVAKAQSSDHDLPRPPPNFGKQALQLAEASGRTIEDLIDAAGYERKTLKRLIDGKGTIKSAHTVRRVLTGWGLDVSSLPPLVDEAMGEEWMRTWVELGKRLHHLANEERFQVELRRIKDVIRSHEVVAEGTGEFSQKRR
jgi:hypothetical protein